MITQFGRPSKDPAWAGLIQHSDNLFEEDTEANDDLLYLLQNGLQLRGCNLMNNGKEDKAHWRCKFYLGGEQRVIGKGTLWQCAKLYDYALIYFEKYRVKKGMLHRRFNFDERDAESDLLLDPGIPAYFETLEKHLLAFGDLMTPEAKKDEQSFKLKATKRAWRKKQTSTYQILERLQENAEGLIILNSEMAAIQKQFVEVNKKLDEIRRVMQTRHDL